MFTFNPETNESVKQVINNLYKSGERCRVWYGNAKTGESWEDELDTTGKIGRSTGTVKIPLMIARANSGGGPSLLTDRIVKIATKNRTLYQHPNFTQPTYAIVKTGNEFVVMADDTHVATFEKLPQAKRFVAFMEGKRFTR